MDKKIYDCDRALAEWAEVRKFKNFVGSVYLFIIFMLFVGLATKAESFIAFIASCILFSFLIHFVVCAFLIIIIWNFFASCIDPRYCFEYVKSL